MSPEQAMAKGMKVDHRTDIYSLGATMYELLTFRPAFAGRDDKEILGQIITKDPPPLRKIARHVPRELETICLKTLEKDAEARYATAKDLADDLRRYVQDLPIVARPLGPVGRTFKFVRRRRALSYAILETVLLAIASVLVVRSSRQSRESWIESSRAKQRERAQIIKSLKKDAITAWQSGQWDDSERYFRSVLDLDPNDAVMWANFANMKKDQFNENYIMMTKRSYRPMTILYMQCASSLRMPSS